MENNYNEWIKLSLYGRQEDVEILTAVISMIENGVMIEDYSDVSTDGLYGALIDESILNADKTHVTVSVFLSADRSLAEAKAFLSERIATLALDAEIRTVPMKDYFTAGENNVYEIWISLKAQGKAYCKNSTGENSLSVDRILLLEPEKK